MLAVLWVVLLEVTRRRGIEPRRIWSLAGAWALPFVAGPPIMDTVVYSDVAYGRLLRSGFDPYAVGPGRLGETALVLAIDPGDRAAGHARPARSARSPPTSRCRSAAAGICSRCSCCAAWPWSRCVWIGRSAIELAGRSARAVALAACVANPLVLLYGLNSPHLDIAMVACLLAALALAGRRRWLAAVRSRRSAARSPRSGWWPCRWSSSRTGRSAAGGAAGYALARDVAVAAR